MNNFSSPEQGTQVANQIALMSTFFSNMFPSIDVEQIQLSAVRRVVLLHYDREKDVVELRYVAVLCVAFVRGFYVTLVVVIYI